MIFFIILILIFGIIRFSAFHEKNDTLTTYINVLKLFQLKFKFSKLELLKLILTMKIPVNYYYKMIIITWRNFNHITNINIKLILLFLTLF